MIYCLYALILGFVLHMGIAEDPSVRQYAGLYLMLITRTVNEKIKTVTQNINESLTAYVIMYWIVQPIL